MKNTLLIMVVFITSLVFASCGGPSFCDCWEELQKSAPDEKMMEKCEEKYGEMSDDEIFKAAEDC